MNRFQIGDDVRIVGLPMSQWRGERGRIIEVIEQHSCGWRLRPTRKGTNTRGTKRTQKAQKERPIQFLCFLCSVLCLLCTCLVFVRQGASWLFRLDSGLEFRRSRRMEGIN